MDKPNFINEEVRRQLGDRRSSYYQAYSGTDIRAVIYLPTLTQGSLLKTDPKKFKIFAELQTMSISSTRSVSPVRVLGRASPLQYTRGARTFAGTLVFATLNKDVFSDIYDVSLAENALSSSTSIIADQMPPFSIIITASNESGGTAIQAVHGITITNYGTTYSVDDLYTETVYTYVATDVTSLTDKQTATTDIFKQQGQANKSVSDLVRDDLAKAYGTVQQSVDAFKSKQLTDEEYNSYFRPDE